ncbi:MAG: hypothetical protein HON65_05325 [Rhodospirillales bacterium]|nr:hypothetical protein [Rhodospirillales bacterium]
MIYKSIQDAIELAASLRPEARAFLGVGVDVSYRQLIKDIVIACRFILSQNLTMGDRTILSIPKKQTSC